MLYISDELGAKTQDCFLKAEVYVTVRHSKRAQAEGLDSFYGDGLNVFSVY